MRLWLTCLLCRGRFRPPPKGTAAIKGIVTIGEHNGNRGQRSCWQDELFVASSLHGLIAAHRLLKRVERAPDNESLVEQAKPVPKDVLKIIAL